MKRLFAFLGVFGIFMRGRAQSFDEWFEQNKTELKYQRAQLMALEEEDEVLQEGYAIDEEGLTRIGRDKQGDLDLHTFYFTTLENVNPAIMADPRVDEILTLCEKSVQIIGGIREKAGSLPPVKSRFDEFCDDVLEMCADDLASMGELLQDGVTELTDAQRLTRLAKVYGGARELNTLVRQAWTDVKFYASISRS
jgi:hypothetical protein